MNEPKKRPIVYTMRKGLAERTKENLNKKNCDNSYNEHFPLQTLGISPYRVDTFAIAYIIYIYIYHTYLHIYKYIIYIHTSIVYMDMDITVDIDLLLMGYYIKVFFLAYIPFSYMVS